MNLKNFAASLVLGLSVLASTQASADASYNIGALDAAPYSTTNPYLNNASVAPGSFLDQYNFSLNNFNQVSNSVSQLTLSLGALNVLDISNLRMRLFSVSNGWQATVLGQGQISTALANGSYFVKIDGIADGLAGGNYTFSAVANPVPEADTFAMMLAGLGMMGFVAARRTVK